MGMIPSGIAIRGEYGANTYLRANDRGEFLTDYDNADALLANNNAANRKRALQYGLTFHRQPPDAIDGTTDRMGRGWAEGRKSINEKIQMSKDSKRYNQRLSDLQRKLELKKLQGVPATEADYREMWKVQDELKNIADSMEYAYGLGQKTKQLRNSLAYDKR